MFEDRQHPRLPYLEPGESWESRKRPDHRAVARLCGNLRSDKSAGRAGTGGSGAQVRRDMSCLLLKLLSTGASLFVASSGGLSLVVFFKFKPCSPQLLQSPTSTSSVKVSGNPACLTSRNDESDHFSLPLPRTQWPKLPSSFSPNVALTS